jgi:RimJ/RimL family protein N-acetyltransferase
VAKNPERPCDPDQLAKLIVDTTRESESGSLAEVTAGDAIRWAIELVEHREMIGTVGLLRFDFEHRRAEVGYEIARRWWGRGLTPEAVAAVISASRKRRISAGSPEARIP